MGDAENALQATKKRAAGREISRDNPGLDDDEDSPEESGTFKKASDEVLATRRIVKVRRQPQTSALSSNPFAGIRLVPPAESTLPKSEVTTEAQSVGEETVSNDVDEKIKSSNENEQGKDEDNKESEENNEAESKAEVGVEAGAEAEAEAKLEPEYKAESAAEEQNSTEEKSDAAADELKPVAENEAAVEEDKTENDEKKDGKTENEEKRDESAPLSSFQQLSSSQNAFTNLSGTGFSTSTFSFGSIASGGSGSGFGTGSGPLFGLKTDQPSFGLGLSNNGNSSLFGTSSSSIVSKSEGSSIPPMKEVEVETGEENEEVVFNADSILYEFMDGGWKERGKGEVKINVSKPEKEKARLVMRARGNYRLILNASLFPDMKLTTMDKKGLSFTCMNSTGDATGVFSTFALKFKDPLILEEFRTSITAHKGKIAAATVLKTPENSPKASDE